MSEQVSVIIVATTEDAPGHFVLLRQEPPSTRFFVWCGRSLGWLPLTKTSSVFQRLFASKEEANRAADKYIELPVQE